MTYEPVIGLEVHAQLKTQSKIFCGCPTEFGGTANDHVCPVCLGMPGVLPVLNKKAVEIAIRSGLALNCQIADETKFDRKNYFYADLSKGYQISQYDQPICGKGYLNIKGKKVRIHRAHLEEDAGKLVHAGAAGLHGSNYSLVDYNRGGVPLLEIVSEPDIESPEQARDYLMELRNILRTLDACDGNLEEGSFRCDANVSVRKKGVEEFGTRTEIKNMNSFKAVQRAIQSEIDRHIQIIEGGGKVVQETRLWDEASGKTFPMRSKEDAHDYRYFPEPDLVPLQISKNWKEELAKTLPELPESKRNRYMELCGLSYDDANVLAEDINLSNFVDAVLALNTQPKSAANLILGPAMAFLKESKLEISQTKLSPQNISDIVEASAKNILNSTSAKQVLTICLEEGGSVQKIIESKGLAQISDEGAIKSIVEKVLADNPSQLADYRAGKTKVRQFFFGETMKALKGKGNPQLINSLLDQLLS